MNTKFYIFRHGLATKSKSGYGAHIVTATLLPEAIPPVKKIGEYLKDIPTDYNVSSRFIRCQETAEIVSKISCKQFVLDKRLNEYYEESFEDLVTRISNFLRDIEKKGYRNVAICTHVAVITVLLKLLKAEPVEKKDIYSNYPLPGTLLIIKDNNVSEINFNQT